MGRITAAIAAKVTVTNPLTVQTEEARASADPALQNRKRTAKSKNAIW